MTDPEFLRAVAHVCEIGDPVEQRDVDRMRTLSRVLERFPVIDSRRAAEHYESRPVLPQRVTDEQLDALLRAAGIQFGQSARDCVATGLIVLLGIEVER
jgi:hypothetical protein